MDYSKLIKEVVESPILVDFSSKMVSRSGALNLICEDWEKELEQSSVHQRHVNKQVLFSNEREVRRKSAKLRRIISSNDTYKLVTFGIFSLDQSKSVELEEPTGDWSIVVRECPPLTRIGEVWRESSEYKLHDGARLFVDTCIPSLCVHCNNHFKMSGDKVDLTRNWCVTKLHYFNGKEIYNMSKNRFISDWANMGSFLAIIHVNMMSRTTFGERKYKIGGQIKNIIVFQESAILPLDVQLKFEDENRNEDTVIATIEYPPQEGVINVRI